MFVVALHIARASAAATPRLGRQRRLALDEPELSPRELATRFADTKNYFASEASVYRLLKEHDLIASPAYIVIKAADEFKDKTTAPNQLWQTDFTYLEVIGWGWFYLSTILDDFSRYIIAWKLCTTMKVETSRKRWTWRYRPLGSIKFTSFIAPDYSRIMVPPTSHPIWPNGWTNATWVMCAAPHAIRRHRARSNAGIKRSRTASCWKTIICPATSKPGSTRSSTTTTIAVIMRAWTISRRPTSTSAADKPFY